jgi:hypothetical protein
MDRELLFRLIRESTSLEKVKDLLRKKALPHTAKSWDDLVDRRLRHNVKSGALSEQDLLELLWASEEYGRQHIFLYRLSDDAPIPSEAKLKATLKNKNLDDLLATPLILDRPEEFVPTGIRLSSDSDKVKAIVKFTGTHVYQERMGETRSTTDTDHVSKLFVEYRIVVDRAVWVAELHSNGVLELRIQSKKNSSMYKDELKEFWSLLAGIFRQKDFEPVDLSRAKEKMWSDRVKLKDELKFVSSKMLNCLGSRMIASAGTIEQDLQEDAGADQSIDAFLGKNDAYCDSLNVWFLEDSSANLESHTHVILSGEMNEFALPANCIKQEHDYIRDRIRSLNK